MVDGFVDIGDLVSAWYFFDRFRTQCCFLAHNAMWIGKKWSAFGGWKVV